MAGKTSKKSVGKAPAAAPKKQIKELEVTEAYLNEHPELIQEGVQVGDIIEAPEGAAVPAAPGATKASKKNAAQEGGTAIIRGANEYVRTYSEEQEEAVEEFLSKDSAYRAVPDESIVSLEVPYDVKKKDGSIERTSKFFSAASNGAGWKADAVVFKNERRSICKAKFA